MPLDITDIAFKDFVYKQNLDDSYEFDSNGDFLPEDRNTIVDTIMATLKEIHSRLIKAKNISPGKILCNEYVLDQALTRYSRDIFGELRLSARINRLRKEGRITETQMNQLSQFYDYGFKIDSVDPYIHRQLAVLLYWLSVLKPFSVKPDKTEVAVKLGILFEFHNEYISYLLCLEFLKAYGLCLDIHKDKDRFYDFLYDLHFRNISRSSLEFFLQAYVKKTET